MTVESFIYYFLLVQTFSVALLDIRDRKISNHWMIANMVIFIACVFIYPEVYSINYMTVLHSFSFIFAGFLLYSLKIMGAGDSKYLFSLFLLMPPTWLESAFVNLLLCTLTIGSFSLLTTIVKNFDEIMVCAKLGSAQGVKKCLGSKFPYAPVIFISWVWLGFKVL
jgi:prepilin peptidase CpaA